MLGARTKQVFSYGRRNRRIVNDSHDPFDEDTKRSPVSRRIREPIGNGHTHTSTFSPHVSPYHRSKKRRGDSKTEPALKRRSVSGSGRQPLSTHSINVSRQSALGGPSKKPSLPGSHGASKTLLPQSPVISVDIIVLDENGRRLSLEKRSKSNVPVNQKKTPHRKLPTYRQATATSVIVVSDSDDDDNDDAPSSPQLARRAKRWPKVMVSSDEEDVAEPPICHTSSPTAPDPNPSPKLTSATSDILKCPTPRHSKPTSPPKSQFWIEIVSPRPPAPPQSRPQALPLFHPPPEASRSKQHQLTPIRRKGSTFTQIPPSPSTPTDLDISFDLDCLTLSSISYEKPMPTNQPAHLLSLLDECGQIAPVEFSAFIEAFPVHPIVQSTYSGPVVFKKIGEASYSEVFGIGDVVLKIIPIRDEECPVRDDVDTPAPSDAADVHKEIVVTRALGEMCDGFVSLLKTYVVRGKYPSLLLDLWDEYNQIRGSESVRPDMLAVSQVYAIIVLPNGGPDLEAYTFSQPTKVGWRQACSLFWQIVRALATAEDLVSFEHRDLHWGQILVKDVPLKAFDRGSAPAPSVRFPMDHPAHGVKATVIDLGLARMNGHTEDYSTEIRWTPFDEEIFEGEGDYQFDIYRLMRKHNGDRWADFRPLTNVMWLHYLLFKLLKSKNLRPPRKSATATGSLGFTERQCYECLLKMEGLLAQSVRGVRTPKLATKNGRRKVASPTKDVAVSTSGPQCAGDVLKFGETMDWV